MSDTIKAPINHVTVYRDRAQVRRGTTIDLEPGEQVIAFDGMWTHADRNSIQVSMGKGAASAMLRSVQFSTRHYSEDVRPMKQELKDKLEGLQLEEQGLEDKKTVVNTRVQALNAIKIKVTYETEEHSDKVYATENWTKFAQFFRAESEKNSKQLREINKGLSAIQKQQREITGRISALGGDYKKTSKDVAEVTLCVTQKVTLELQLSYLVRNASWSPVYDLRADSKEKTMSVAYNAMVRQATGEDWENVKVTLSTAKPSTGGTAPELSPWYVGIGYDHSLNFYEQQQEAPPMMMQQMMTTNMFQAAPSASASGPSRSRTRAQTQTATVEATSSSTSANYSIPGTHKVRNDNEPVKLSIMHHTFNVHLRYSAVPKLDNHVYLKAKAINNTDFQFIAGKANVYADNQFISTSKMDDVAPTEEFWTFLGVDDSLKATRQLIHRKRSETGGMLSSSRRHIEFKYSFKLKNTKMTEEELVVWDSLPICENKKITSALIEPNEKSKYVYKINELQAIEWFVNLKPKEEVTLNFVFNVEHPLDEHVSGL